MAAIPVASAIDGSTPAPVEENQDDKRAFQRAKVRFPFEVAYVLLATAVAAFNLAAFFLLAEHLNKKVEQAKNLRFPSNRAALRSQYDIRLSNDPNLANELCDIVYFDEAEFGFLQNNLYSLKDAAFAFFYISAIPVVAFTFYRLGHLRRLYFQRSRDLMSSKHSGMAVPVGTLPSNPNTNPLGRLNIGNVTVAGEIHRTERFTLRGETSGYIILQIFGDIPYVLIFFLYISFVERYRGLNCAVGFQNGEIREVPGYFSLTFTSSSELRLAMIATFLHVGYNYVALCIRWFKYLQTVQPPWIFGKQFALWFLSTLCFVTSFIFPIGVLFAAYIGPLYYGFEDVATAIGLSGVGGGTTGIGLLAFLAYGGLEVGESIFAGLFCFNFWEIFFFAIPCLEFLEGTFMCCEIGGNQCCCNICCC